MHVIKTANRNSLFLFTPHLCVCCNGNLGRLVRSVPPEWGGGGAIANEERSVRPWDWLSSSQKAAATKKTTKEKKHPNHDGAFTFRFYLGNHNEQPKKNMISSLVPARPAALHPPTTSPIKQQRKLRRFETQTSKSETQNSKLEIRSRRPSSAPSSRSSRSSTRRPPSGAWPSRTTGGR